MSRPLLWASMADLHREAHEDEANPHGCNLSSVVREVPVIEHDDAFRDVVRKLARYIACTIDLPSTFEQLRTTSLGEPLRYLVNHLVENVTNPAIVNALLALRWHYGASGDERGIGEARANACEIVAWRFLTRLSEREAVDFCLYEIPDPKQAANAAVVAQAAQRHPSGPGESNELTTLLRPPRRGAPADPESGTMGWFHAVGSQRRAQLVSSLSRLTLALNFDQESPREDDHVSSSRGGGNGDGNGGGGHHAHAATAAAAADPTLPFTNLNALEIAAIADAKRFLSQHAVQKIITGIWNGDIIFWDQLSTGSVKRPRFYNPHTADPFCRLRVPKYLKAYEVMFFASFLVLYYAVLIQRSLERITELEVLLYLWFAAFFYDEVSEYLDAGSIFYTTDVWNLFDMVMMAIGVVFAVLRFVGLYTGDKTIISNAFNVLSLEALFMVPKVCSILSLSPYWGTMIPCLKEMGKDFLKFMVLVVIIYAGFLTTFSLIGRDHYSFKVMAMIITKIFFGSSYVGFDIMDNIDPIFGPPLMIVFVTLSSILLMSSLAGMLSNSFSRVISHAREEYLYIYSIYVLEASTSNRLTHFYPPLNLISLVTFRPLRLFINSGIKFRQARIMLLKATHLPIVLVIELYEWIMSKMPKKRESYNTLVTRQSTFKRLACTSLLSEGQRPRTAPQPESDKFNQPPLTHRRRTGEEEELGDGPANATEIRLAELSDKIDRLTDVMASMKAELARLKR